MKRVIRLALSILLCISLLSAATSARAELAPPGPFEQGVNNAVPAGYGEILNFYMDKLKNNPNAALDEIYEKLDRYTKALSRISAIIEIAGKIDSGDTRGMAVSTSLAILGELAGSQAGTAYLKAAGLTTLPVTTLILAVQIYEISVSELNKATVGRQLESLYGTIESDTFIKNRNRELGTGDPIPVNQKNLEHLWRKILLNNSFRNLFKVYVTEVLGKTWPEASYWDSWTLPGNALEDAALLQNEQEYKSFLAGLLSHLNWVAKKRESEYVMRTTVRNMQSRFSNLNPKQIFASYVSAVKRLPDVHEFIKACPELIQRGLQDRSPGPLTIVIDSSRSYAVDVLRFLPDTGSLGAERNKLLASLKDFYTRAWSAKEFIMKKRQQELREEVLAVPVRAWKATQVGFNQSFGGVKGEMEAEFLRTGAIKNTTDRIDNDFREMREAYRKQEQRVAAEYAQAQQQRTADRNRSEMAYKAFFSQLRAYEALDNVAYSDLSHRIGIYAATLAQQQAAKEQEISNYLSQLSRLKTTYVQGYVSAANILVERFCAEESVSLPSANYVGLLKIDFPQQTLDPDDPDPSHYTDVIYRHLSSLERSIDLSRRVTLCNGEREFFMSTLIDVAGETANLNEDATQIKENLVLYQETLNEAQTKIASYPGPPSLNVDRVKAAIQTDHLPYLRNAEKLTKKVASLATGLSNKKQGYQTALENIDKDLSYLKQLQHVVLNFKPVLMDFRERYNNYSSFQPHKGKVIFHPDLVSPESRPSCDLIDQKPTLMIHSDAAMALQELKSKLAAQQLLWLDKKYNLQFEKLANNYINKNTQLKTALYPKHYQFISDGASCYLVYDDYLSALAKSIQDISRTDSQFPKELEKSLLVKRGANPLGPRRLLGLPLTSTLSSIDIDNLPENHLDFIKGLIKKSWDPVMASSLQSVIDAFLAKLAAYRDWQSKEAYFKEKMNAFEVLSGKFGNLEYDANAANNAMADTSELIQAFGLAVAMEQPLIGFLNGAAADNKLSSSRQSFFVNQKPRYESRFNSLKQLLESFKRRRQAPPQPPSVDHSKHIAKVREFYDVFQQDYASMSESALLSHLSDNWEAGDGTTLMDVEDYFHNMFSVFDEIQVSITGLNVQPLGNGRYQVNYETLITGRIFADNLEHEEKSSVSEEVEVAPSGKIKIMRTPQGQFWYVR